MLYAIVPVKPLHLAKGRLAPVLSATERQTLVLAMFSDVLEALGAAALVTRLGVISSDTTVLALAESRGVEALRDSAGDLNGALAQGAAHAIGHGASATLVLPADLPLVTPSEIDSLIAALGPARGAVLAPARDGGTNALLACPPLALPFLFGSGSLARHQASAQLRGIPTRIVRAPGLELDVDRPDDLLALAEAPGATAAQRLVRDLQIAGRLACVY